MIGKLLSENFFSVAARLKNSTNFLISLLFDAKSERSAIKFQK